MATELYHIGPDEISLVDRGANQRPILVRKRDGGGLTDAEKVEFTKQLDTLRALAGDRLEIIKASVDALADFENMNKVDIQAAFNAISDQLWDARSDVVALAKRDDGVGAVTLAKTFIAIAKVCGISEFEITKADNEPEEVTMADEAHVEKVELSEEEMAAVAAVQTMLGGGDAASADQMAMAKAVLDKVTEAGGVYPKPDAVEMAEHPDDEEEVEMAKKDIPAAVQKQLETLEKRLEDETVLRKNETHLRLTAEHVQKCQSWRNIMKADDAGPILKSIHGKVSDDEYAWIEKQLDSAQQVAKSATIFTELGSLGDGDAGGDANTKLNAIAKRYVDEKKATTFAKAHVMASDEHPDLVREIHASNQRD